MLLCAIEGTPLPKVILADVNSSISYSQTETLVNAFVTSFTETADSSSIKGRFGFVFQQISVTPA
jgi:hypothetical protein